MHPFSIVTLGIFVAGYVTARWNLVGQLGELTVFSWEHGVITRAAKGFVVLSIFYFLFVIPVDRIAAREVALYAQLMTAKPSSAEDALRRGILYRNSGHPMSRVFQLCATSAFHVIGLTNSREKASPLESCQLSAFTTSASSFPRILRSPAARNTVQVVVFDPPDPTRMQYMSLDPIPLALAGSMDREGHATVGFETLDQEEMKEWERKRKLVEKMKLHTVGPRPWLPTDCSIPDILNQINCSFELSSLLQSNAGLIGARPKRSLSVSERVVESASTLWECLVSACWRVVTVHIYPVLRKGLVFSLACHRLLAEVVLRVLEWRLRPEYAALKDISATAQQVDIRLQQICYWPFQYCTLRNRKDDWESVTRHHPEYIRFYNSLWLVANDVIIGIAIGSYIIDNADWAANQLSVALSLYTVEGLQRMIAWLMDWPAGLKLNNELAAFLGDLFLWVIDYWAGSVAGVRWILRHAIYFVGICGFAGATMPIALCSDLVSLLTLHIYCFYVASARIYNWQLSVIISLFHLFRGKKRNVLRNRIDSCDYDLDQLLLGTILFTLLFFLLPTVAVFYLTFASARMMIISLKAALDTLLAFLNHFPLFALMLRIKDSRRLPGGIRFELANTKPAADPSGLESYQGPTPYIYLKSVPLSFRAMLQQYFQLGHRLRQHYLSPQVIFCLATGRFVPPIHRRNLYSLQYSMLPRRRAAVSEMWALLTQPPPATTTAPESAASTAPKHRSLTFSPERGTSDTQPMRLSHRIVGTPPCCNSAFPHLD
ncbi:MAG: phosphatidylinositol N-acetylglucosaminyltransferase subunit gpi1 [Phylliscum demangeonii]|nr:MAG: phosphatidylinositol N-acetylglucosaminyltransferase subunit gpi1 [Phylliscum demangeonii]